MAYSTNLKQLFSLLTEWTQLSMLGQLSSPVVADFVAGWWARESYIQLR